MFVKYLIIQNNISIHFPLNYAIWRAQTANAARSVSSSWFASFMISGRAHSLYSCQSSHVVQRDHYPASSSAWHQAWHDFFPQTTSAEILPCNRFHWFRLQWRVGLGISVWCRQSVQWLTWPMKTLESAAGWDFCWSGLGGKKITLLFCLTRSCMTSSFWHPW